MRKLSHSEYRESRWKNGRGKTWEIAVFPADASIDDFEWRISMAQVETEAAFSIFKGMDRSLLILSGEGVHLTVDGVGHALAAGADAFRFDGGAVASARPADGTVIDFNVMTRRGRVEHEVRRVGKGTRFIETAGLLALFSTRGAALEFDDTIYELEPWATLLGPFPQGMTITDGEVLAVQISMIPLPRGLDAMSGSADGDTRAGT